MRWHTFRRPLRTAAAVGAALALSGCWLQEQAGPDRTNANPTETHLTAANVATLQEVWRTDGFDPVAAGGTVYVHVIDQDGNSVKAVAASTGTTRWQTTPNAGVTFADGPFVLDPGTHTVRLSPSGVSGGSNKVYAQPHRPRHRHRRRRRLRAHRRGRLGPAGLPARQPGPLLQPGPRLHRPTGRTGLRPMGHGARSCASTARSVTRSRRPG